MKKITFFIFLMTFSIGNAQIDPSDDFEGNGNITWKADNNEMNTSFDNPAPGGINTSAKVLEYSDEGGTYSNIQFDLSTDTTVKYDLTTKNVFTLKVFVPTPTVAVTQSKILWLKLQDGSKGGNSWEGQVVKEQAYEYDVWQELTFDFSSIKSSLDRSRLVIQFNGENNSEHVKAYIDDISIGEGDGTVVDPPAAPVPSIADGNAYSIYNDTNGYTSTFPVEYSFGSATDVDLDDGTDVNNALKVDLSSAGFGQGEGGPDDVSEYNYVNFNYWYSGTSGFRFVMIDNDGTVSEFHYEIGSVAEGDQADIVSETWTQLYIPMSFFTDSGMDSSKLFQWKVDRYRVDSNNGGLLFLDNIILTKNNILSVEDTNTFKSIIYPNPTSSRLTISAPKIINNVAIYNLLGKQVMSIEVNKNTESIDVSNLPSGVYLIRYNVDNAVGTAKFVKQ